MVESPESAGQQRPPRGQRTTRSPQQRPPEPLFQVETISKRWNPRAPSSLPEQSCSSDLPTPRVGNHRTNRILPETARTRVKNADQNRPPCESTLSPGGSVSGRAFWGRAFWGRASFWEGELPREPQTLPHKHQLSPTPLPRPKRHLSAHRSPRHTDFVSQPPNHSVGDFPGLLS